MFACVCACACVIVYAYSLYFMIYVYAKKCLWICFMFVFIVNYLPYPVGVECHCKLLVSDTSPNKICLFWLVHLILLEKILECVQCCQALPTFLSVHSCSC